MTIRYAKRVAVTVGKRCIEKRCEQNANVDARVIERRKHLVSALSPRTMQVRVDNQKESGRERETAAAMTVLERHERCKSHALHPSDRDALVGTRIDDRQRSRYVARL